MKKTKESKTEEKKIPERAKVEDVEAIVIDLAKKGNSPSKIGIVLKEKYGIYNIKALGKKISKILKENKIEHEDDLSFVGKKLKNIEKHYEKNHQDKRAEREIVRLISLRKKLEIQKIKN
jgi:small subunit ribosomal protein S15